jgi:hypothetical protein
MVVGAARAVHFSPGSMASQSPDPPSFLDESKLQLVRDFLLREFRGYYQADYFDEVERAQVFIVESEHGRRHTLVVPLGTFAVTEFMWFCTPELAATLKAAPEGRFTLMPNGVLVH